MVKVTQKNAYLFVCLSFAYFTNACQAPNLNPSMPVEVKAKGTQSFPLDSTSIPNISASPASSESPLVIAVPPDSPTVSGFTNSLGMKFVSILPGTFMMGSPETEANRVKNETEHQVTLTKGFSIQTTEATQAQWQSVMGNNPSVFKGDNLPVESVSWDDVQQFIQKLNNKGQGAYRLPTEAEWEYATRAGTTTTYACGDSKNCLDSMAWYGANAELETHPVAQKQPNAWGLYDMHGNVWEWVQDRYGDYPGGSVIDPRGPDNGSTRVIRGGSWYYTPQYTRSALRSSGSPSAASLYYIGFRLVKSLP